MTIGLHTRLAIDDSKNSADRGKTVSLGELADSGLVGGGSISVTDGSTTVYPATSLDFTSGATVTDGGSGVAQIAVSGAGGLTATKTITHAALLTLGDAPIEVVATPGASKFIFVDSYVFTCVGGSVGYDGANSPNVSLGYGTNDAILGTLSYNANNATFVKTGSSGVVTGTLALSLDARLDQPLLLTGENLTHGGILAVTVGDSGGTDYAVGDTGKINTFDRNAHYVVDAISGGGGTGPVTDLHITNDGGGNDGIGGGYIVSNNNATQILDGAGDGNLTVNITDNTVGNGTGFVTVNYHIVDMS